MAVEQGESVDTSATGSAQPAPGAELTGLQVLDFSSGILGGYCAKLLGDAGADVVKVEAPEGDPLRRWVSDGRDLDGSDGALFRYLHHGHRSVVAAEFDDRVAALVAGADAVISDRSGLLADPAALANRHPHLVVVAVTPYGLDGPFADRPATDLTVQAESGALAVRGHPSRPPVQEGARVTEWVTGLYAGVAALGALLGARDGGRGRLVDVSACEVGALTGSLFSDLTDSLRGRIPLDQMPPARTFETPSIEPTLDGYVGFNTNTRVQFDSFLLMIERTDLLDAGWESISQRLARWDEWNDIVHSWTSRHTTADVIERAAELRIPVAPVCNAPAALALDHPRVRGVFVDDPTGTFTVPRRSWWIDGELPDPPRPAPRLGEHTATVEPRPPRSIPTAGAQRLPLDGVKVVDLTAWWAGPSATGMLGALGADVIHIESVSRPDGMRMSAAYFSDRAQWWEYSSMFLAANTNKRGLTLDLNHPTGRELLLRLVADADLVIENFTPRVLEQFDLGWDVIHAANPRAVMVRMPAFGLTGPWRDRPGFAQTMEQVTGLAWLTGDPDDQPRIQRGPCDPNGGMHAAFAALVGLARRDRTGEGCFVEAPMVEAAFGVAAEMVIEWTAYGNQLAREGSRSPWAAPQGLYPCPGREQWLTVSVVSDEQWTALVDVLGKPDWALDPELATLAGRRAHHDLLDQHLAAWAASTELDDAVRMLIDAGVPAAPAVDPRRVSEHEQLRARGFYEVIDHPVIGPHPIPAVPFRYRGVDRWLRRPAPTIGQHNHEILAGLGCSDTDIATLEAEHIVGDWPLGL